MPYNRRSFGRRRKFRRPYKKSRRSTQTRYLPKRTKMAITKSIGYKGFHCFKETTSGSLRMTPIATNNPYNYELQNLQVNGLDLPNAAWQFNINHVADWGNYARLFQQFRVTGVAIKFFPAHNVSNFPVDTVTSSSAMPPIVQSTATNIADTIPSLVYKFDPNDTVNTTSWSSLLEKDPTFRPTNRIISLYIKRPRLNMVQQDQGVGQASIEVNTKSAKWCNWDSVTTQLANTTSPYTYKGMDMGCHNIVKPQQLQFIMTYYFQCKTPT